MTYPPQDPYAQQPPAAWPPQQQYAPPPGPYLVPSYAPPGPPQRHRKMVTRRHISAGEHIFHGCMTLASCGLWGFVWWSRVRGGRTVTTW